MDVRIAIHRDWYGKITNTQMRYYDILKYNNIPVDFVDSNDQDFWNYIENYTHFIYRFCVYDDHKQIADKILPIIETYYGLEVFPSQDTAWSYDDKIKQYFLLHAYNFPVVESWVFFDKKKALDWAQTAEYPVVFKLKSGSGAQNVLLVRNKEHCESIIKRMFGKGVITDKVRIPGSTYFKDLTLKNYLRDQAVKVKKFLNNEDLSSYWTVQKNYCLFQKYLPENDYDTRITTIGDRAFGSIRYTRKNDFRASGSGTNDFNKDSIDTNMVDIALNISKKFNYQSMAYDFIYDENSNPRIVEISYTYPDYSIDQCEGYWDSNLEFHEGSQSPQYYQLIDLLGEQTLQVPDKMELDNVEI